MDVFTAAVAQTRDRTEVELLVVQWFIDLVPLVRLDHCEFYSD